MYPITSFSPSSQSFSMANSISIPIFKECSCQPLIWLKILIPSGSSIHPIAYGGWKCSLGIWTMVKLYNFPFRLKFNLSISRFKQFKHTFLIGKLTFPHCLHLHPTNTPFPETSSKSPSLNETSVFILSLLIILPDTPATIRDVGGPSVKTRCIRRKKNSQSLYFFRVRHPPHRS